MRASKREFIKVWIAAKPAGALLRAGLWSSVIIFFALVSGCQDSRRPSYILIAADQLSFNSFSCVEDRISPASGLNTLCHESIRFSNAFTTSTQSAAAMASLLTGAYPFRHKLHRSFDRLDPDLPVLAEFFKARHYRTAFWSAKPTILRKTGLARGFDLFDDTYFLGQAAFSTDFRQQARQFESWAAEDSAPFLAVLYNADLELLNEGETQISNLEKFDESLGQFFARLKELNLWESNYIVVAGLQGKSDYGRVNESVFSNLHGENTNVALFIKPPRQKGDEGINWKIDTTLTVADFGFSLIRTLDPAYRPPEDHPRFPVWDISGLWSTNEVDSLPNSPRQVLIEGANTWKAALETRYALLFKNYLFLEGSENELYNKLTDGLETINLNREQPDEVRAEDLRALQDLRRTTDAARWTQFMPAEYRWVRANRAYWSQPNDRAAVFAAESARLKKEKRTQPLSTLLVYFQNPQREKDMLYERARRHSYNLSLENVWGLWDKNRVWPQPRLTTANQ